MLNLTWDDVSLKQNNEGQYVSVRLRWHKKASVESDCQIYHLWDERSFPCLKVCGLFSDYVAMVKNSSPNLTSRAYVFPSFTMQQDGIPRVNWHKQLDQNQVRLHLKEIVEKSCTLPIGISLHSMRRGGAFYRVFESQERRFNFRELMAWCRWNDEKTLCEYLITRSISSEIDPKNLLAVQRMNSAGFFNGIDPQIQEICKAIANGVLAELTTAISSGVIPAAPTAALSSSTVQISSVQAKKQSVQRRMDAFVAQTSIPTARSAKEAWDQWFIGDHDKGLLQPLKSFTQDMVRMDRKKYSERRTLSLAFAKYPNYETFEAAYVGHTNSYRSILSEVRKRKAEDCL